MARKPIVEGAYLTFSKRYIRSARLDEYADFVGTVTEVYISSPPEDRILTVSFPRLGLRNIPEKNLSLSKPVRALGLPISLEV